MDPFLEDPTHWRDVHNRLLNVIAELMAAATAPRYSVRVEERVYLTDPDHDPGFRQYVPDVVITETPRKRIREPVATGGLAVVEPVKVQMLFDPEVHDYYLQVYDAESREVVTAIELLSPTNKVEGSRGREAMKEKQSTLHRAGCHLVEIDVLRAGERHPRLADRSDYCVSVWPARESYMWVWYIDLRDRLPAVNIPLREPDEDAVLDLQQALDTAYDRARYADMTDYAGPIPDPPLKPADRSWVERTLAAWRESRSRDREAAAPGSPGSEHQRVVEGGATGSQGGR